MSAEYEFESVCSTVEQVTGHRPKGGKRNRKGVCPAHQDDKPSLSIRHDEEASVIGVTCFAGCSFEEIRDALGLENSAFRASGSSTKKRRRKEPPSQPEPRPGELGTEVERYPYTDEAGKVLYYNVRFEPKDFRMADASGQVKGLPKNVRRVPYNLPAVLEAIESGAPVWWVEGEKDVQSLVDAGVVATTTAGGSQYPLDPEWADWFKGAEVVVVQDRDKSGAKYARSVAKLLVNHVASLRTVQPATKQPKSDISDHLAQGWGLDQVLEVSYRSVRRSRWTLVDLLASEPEPIEWVLPGVIPQGLTLLVGAPKAGKSWLNLNLMTALATGRPDSVFGSHLDFDAFGPTESLYLALEDPHRRISERMRKITSGLHLQRPALVGDVWLDLPPIDEGGKEEIEKWLEAHPGARAVMVDVLAKVRGTEDTGGGMYQADYKSVGFLKDIADDYGVGVVVTHHDRKKADEDDFVNMVSGTKGITGAADTILYLQRKRGQSTGTLKLESRDVEECTYNIEFLKQFGRWELLGKKSDDEPDGSGPADTGPPIMEQIQRHLMVKPNCTNAEIARAIGKPEDSVRRELSRGREDGLLERNGRAEWFIPSAGPRPVK